MPVRRSSASLPGADDGDSARQNEARGLPGHARIHDVNEDANDAAGSLGTLSETQEALGPDGEHGDLARKGSGDRCDL